MRCWGQGGGNAFNDRRRLDDSVNQLEILESLVECCELRRTSAEGIDLNMILPILAANRRIGRLLRIEVADAAGLIG